MKHKSARPAENIESLMDTYGNMLFRLCLITLGNTNDAEDVIQETMIKYLQKSPIFKNAEHEKAWLITVATNKCKDILRFRKRHPIADVEELYNLSEDKPNYGILDVLMTLPDKYRIVLTLYYVEEYSINDIAKMIGRTSSAVKMRLQKGRKLLAEAYQKE